MHNGPGKFTVTAGMSGSMHNNHTAQVLLLNPVELELPESLAEWITGTAIQVILTKALNCNDQTGALQKIYLLCVFISPFHTRCQLQSMDLIRTPREG